MKHSRLAAAKLHSIAVAFFAADQPGPKPWRGRRLRWLVGTTNSTQRSQAAIHCVSAHMITNTIRTQFPKTRPKQHAISLPQVGSAWVGHPSVSYVLHRRHTPCLFARARVLHTFSNATHNKVPLNCSVIQNYCELTNYLFS